jgi:hypothetical protein
MTTRAKSRARARANTEDWKSKLTDVWLETRATSRAALDALVDDCTSFVETALRSSGRVLGRAATSKTTMNVWLPSFLTLGAVDTALSSARIARSAKGLGIVGAAGGVGLIAASTLDLMRSSSAEEVLDATGDLAWGIQALSYITAAPTAAKLTAGLGFVGAVVQMSAGMLRITQGVRTRDGQLVKLGTLDVGGGVLWAALDVAAWGNPLVLGSYIVLMVGREAYANKDAILRKLRRSPPLLLPPPRLVGVVVE